jgi:hypothetical protein
MVLDVFSFAESIVLEKFYTWEMGMCKSRGKWCRYGNVDDRGWCIVCFSSVFT